MAPPLRLLLHADWGQSAPSLLRGPRGDPQSLGPRPHGPHGPIATRTASPLCSMYPTALAWSRIRSKYKYVEILHSPIPFRSLRLAAQAGEARKVNWRLGPSLCFDRSDIPLQQYQLHPTALVCDCFIGGLTGGPFTRTTPSRRGNPQARCPWRPLSWSPT